MDKGSSSSRLKRCSSSSTDAEAAHDANNATDPLQKDRELDDLETEVDQKRQKKHMKEEKETTEKNVEAVYECSFATKDSKGNNEHTIFVTGFDPSGSRNEIKSALTTHFSSCGEITRVFVPIECKTGASLGYAFINLEKGGERKALTLNGSDLGGQKLLVTMANRRDEFYFYKSFKGCEICLAAAAARRMELYKWNMRSAGGFVQPLTPELDEMLRALREK